MEWIKNKLWNLGEVFEEFPKVFWLSMFYIILSAIAMFSFFPSIHAIANFNFMGTLPVYNLIAENYEMLRWGVLVIPVTILLWGWADVDDVYLKLRNRKYGY